MGKLFSLVGIPTVGFAAGWLIGEIWAAGYEQGVEGGNLGGRRLRLLRESDIGPTHIFTMSTASITSKEMRKLVCNKICLLPIDDLREVFKQAQKMIAPEKFIVAGDGIEAIDAKLRFVDPVMPARLIERASLNAWERQSRTRACEEHSILTYLLLAFALIEAMNPQQASIARQVMKASPMLPSMNAGTLTQHSTEMARWPWIIT